MWNHARAPPAGGLRLRGRRRSTSPPSRGNLRARAGADGQHRGVEAGRARASLSRTSSWSCSRRPACRRASSTSCRATRWPSAAPCSSSPDLAGIHFTGSTAVFQTHVARSRPTTCRATAAIRASVGETGGKDFVLAHPSADADDAGRGAAARRLRVPGAEVLARRRAPTSPHRCGRPCASALVGDGRGHQDGRRRPTSRNFMGAVIDRARVRPASTGTSATRSQRQRREARSPAARPTTAWATSSRRRVLEVDEPAPHADGEPSCSGRC